VEAYSNQKYEDALNLVRMAQKAGRNFYQARHLEGRKIFIHGSIKQAEKIIKRLIANYPEYTEARIWYMRCLILSENYEEAKKQLDKELSFNTSDWRVYNLYSLLAQRTDDYEQRLSMNRRAETALTDSAKVYMDQAITWYALGMENRAQEYLEKARNITGTNLSMRQLEDAVNQFLQE
jgi:tetratricopeptide (TPR) repeat protein